MALRHYLKMPYRRWAQSARVIFFFAVLTAALYFLFGGNEHLVQSIERSTIPSWFWLLLCCVVYAVVLMTPFAPGMELGILIMAMFGTVGIIAAWLTTVFALTLAFIISGVGQSFLWVQRLLFISQRQRSLPRAVSWVRSRLAKHPYLSIAILLNLPGNMILGGGGGIAIISGATGTVKLYRFFVTVLLASSLFPLALLTGLATLR